MSFDPKSKAHKARLYPVLKALAELDPRKTPELIMDDAVGYPVARGQDYVRNMRRGEIAATYATLIHQWLIKHHFDLAHRLAPEIFPETSEQRWRSILDKHARPDCLRLVIVPHTMGIVERESQLKPADTTVRGQWHSIPLGQNGEASTAIQSGQNHLPTRGDGKLDPLSENHDEGLHKFVLITAPTPEIPTDINTLVTWVADNPCDLHRVSVQVIK